ncbi:putative MFS family arabinose efflux permease [Frondihabitans sp. PhB188]|uniref:MFS transporter n=1 Tax=Frondihabitans sp. PhB188 TaxID=2485200 RepID=UPI000F47DBE2|nr:MFS transporter [Frondihabitans sp. PhB188]ROQ39391.1 putative MFS family arabinose efflux permease [Frondihabitans sp. PhB188]
MTEQGTTTPRADLAEEPVNPRRWRILGVCLAMSFLTMLDVSIVNVALPTIQTSLHASSLGLQLLVAGYTLTFGLTLVASGRLGDAGYRRQLLLGGLVLFVAASLAAALAPNELFLVIARLIQGAAAGVVNPQGMGLVQQVFRRDERGRAFGFNGAVIGLSNTIGPVLGGVIIFLTGTVSGWRWVFGVSVPIALIILAFAWRLVPAQEKQDRRHVSLDGGGLLVITLTTLALMFPFVTTTGVGDNPNRWWSLAVAGLGIVVLYFVERRVKSRGGSVIVDMSVLNERSFRNGTALGVAYFAGLNSVALIVTLFLQEGLKFPALQAGLVTAPFAVGSAFVAVRAGKLVMRYGRPLVVGGLIVACVGIGAASLIAYLYAHGTHLPGGVGIYIAAAMLVAGCGSGSVLSPNLTLTMQNVPVPKAGVSSSMMQVGQRLGSAIGISIALSVYYSVVASGGTAAEAAHRTLTITLGFFGVALLVALFDSLQRRRLGIALPTKSGRH